MVKDVTQFAYECQVCQEVTYRPDRAEALAAAKEHEDIPVLEGDYHGMVVCFSDQFDRPSEPLILSATNGISSLHGKIYSIWGVHPLRSAKFKEVACAHSIAKGIVEGTVQGIGAQELSRLIDSIDPEDRSDLGDIVNVESLRTLSKE
jgi:hypothetical protein